jgi:DNA-binding response OmpR family regulator
VYVVLVTQRNKTEDVVTGILAGADDFISKPYESAELKAHLYAAERLVALARAVCPSCYDSRVQPLLANLRMGRRAS